MTHVLNSLLPGIDNFFKRNVFYGLLCFLPPILLCLWGYYYLDANESIALFLIVVLSNVYRGQYTLYWQKIKSQFFDGNMPVIDSSAAELADLSKPPVWWMPVLNWNWMLLFSMIATVHMLATNTHVDLSTFSDGWPVVKEFIHGLLNPEWSLVESAIFVYARQTVEVALLGSAIGFVLALPISFFCAQNLMSGSVFGRVCYFICRSIMVVLRAIPTFLLGLIFVALVGLGPFPGVLAITVFSMGVMVKLFSEAIEAADPGIAEAVYASGGNWVNMVVFGILPQVTPAIIAQLLYCVEINVHSATVLGLIGAEGIGLPIHEYLSALAYDRAAVFILITILMTIVIDYSSAYIRKKII